MVSEPDKVLAAVNPVSWFWKEKHKLNIMLLRII